jgi:cell division protein FtsW (lipid II flippase)
MTSRNGIDRGVLLVVFLLAGIGVVQVYSSSFIFAIDSRADGLYFFKRQLAFLPLSLALLFSIAYFPHRWLKKLGLVLWAIAAFAVAATLLAQFGIRAGGAARWLRLPGAFVFEPSELLKILLPVYLGWWAQARENFHDGHGTEAYNPSRGGGFGSKGSAAGGIRNYIRSSAYITNTKSGKSAAPQKKSSSFLQKLSGSAESSQNSESQSLAKFANWWRVMVLFIPFLIVYRQPDFGTIVIMSVVTLATLFAFGLRWRYIISTLVVALPAFFLMVMMVPYRRARVLAFLNPWADADHKGFQVIQSMLSFQAGGMSGVGLGEGQGKLFFLPEAHTDFTMAVLGEEIGFIGFMVILSLYGFLVLRGMQIAVQARSRFNQVLALGLSLTFAFSVFINCGVVMGLLPTKGLTLPFLSYGGSSLVCNCLLFGLLLNVERSERLNRPLMQRF